LPSSFIPTFIWDLMSFIAYVPYMVIMAIFHWPPPLLRLMIEGWHIYMSVIWPSGPIQIHLCVWMWECGTILRFLDGTSYPQSSPIPPIGLPPRTLFSPMFPFGHHQLNNQSTFGCWGRMLLAQILLL
jgi:hypothetical protein